MAGDGSFDYPSFVRAARTAGSTPNGVFAARVMWGTMHRLVDGPACISPVRLAGSVHTVNTATGELVDSRATADMPDTVIHKACCNRRAAVCPACAEVNRADAYQLILVGLRGGKGIPDTVAGHPAVFATLIAPFVGAGPARTAGGEDARQMGGPARS